MASSPIRPRWQRIYRQTLTLIYKNFLIFYRAPISVIFRTLLLPIAFTVVMCVLKNLNASSPYSSSENGAIASTPTPIMDLDVAMKSSPAKKLVFVRNGFPEDVLSSIVDGIVEEQGEGLDIRVMEEVDDLFDVCKQSLIGSSDCFASVIFTSVNTVDVEYSIGLDSAIADAYSYGSDYTNSLLETRILPLQWAIDSRLNNLTSDLKPAGQPWAGEFYDTMPTPAPGSEESTTGPVWLALIGMFIAPIFILILIGVSYHISVFVATERQNSISELMQAQMVTDAPRILSNILSFLALYFPGFLICSILLTQLLFVKTSDILLLFLTLLAGTSLTTASHFMASFFGKAQLAGLYISTLAFALSMVSLAASLLSSSPYMATATGEITDSTANTQVLALSLIFPPYTWATLIGDIANREYTLTAFSLSPVGAPTAEDMQQSIPPQEALQGYLYVVFFLVQIVVYGAATYGLERGLWGVKRTFEPIEESSGVALRCTNLSKTYHGTRRWYWPFTPIGSSKLAVDSLNLEVKKGSVTFLLGPNGGGKTTTLKCVAGMTAMDSGSRLEINEAGTVFGICPQQNVFWDTLTVEEHIKIWRKLKTAAFMDAGEEEDDVLGECDLTEKVKAKAKTLSGGQMRKLQLAISFVGGSKVCCIDEASSGLDPLSRRNIWNIIQKGHARRTILVTTHFLDEADVLADHIAILYKTKLVCEGPGTSLKAQYGGDYLIQSNPTEDDDPMVWKTSNSAQATRKILELESSTDETYNVVFPTLEQVFLKVTSDDIYESARDGAAGEEDAEDVINEKLSPEAQNARDMDLQLDVSRSIGVARQVFTLFKKRYTLLLHRSGWISYTINLIIPIIIAGILGHFLPKFDSLQTCQMNIDILRISGLDQGSDLAPFDAHIDNTFSVYPGESVALLSPRSAFEGDAQDDLYTKSMRTHVDFYDSGYGSGSSSDETSGGLLDSRTFVDDTDDIIAQIKNTTSSFYGFGIWSPTPDSAVFFYDTPQYNAENYMSAFSYLTNRLADATKLEGTVRTSSANIRVFTYPESTVNFLNLPISLLLVLGFVAAASIAVVYPAFEKINRVRALHYCNGVSPFALWLGYLLFDMQLIIIQSFVVWGVAFTGSLTRLYFEPTYILGALILFGIATYLGTYLVSLFVKKAAFAIAAGLHILLFVLYFVGYVVNQSSGKGENQHMVYSMLQYVLGLTSPGANLARALFVSMNAFDVLCGKYGDDTSGPFSYQHYGSVYTNLLIQIVFLITMLIIYEYGSADWFRRNIMRRGAPPRLHYTVDSGQGQPQIADQNEKQSRILNVDKVSKAFGRVFATENISFDISSNETLALLGGNGAGKTTMINLIRGELKPDFGNIELNGISVLRQPHKARVHMGVCPQDDAVDNLTVRQTLNFYASVKGLKNVSGNVDKVLSALNITMYERVLVKALSGGTKRKLSVAIALLGNPRVLLLDEPSTGQDAGAKRILWRTLQGISSNRAILLTTHSMEEAEALATDVAIMGTRMLAKGTLNSLQDEHGGLYSVRAVRTPESSAAEVQAMVRELFGGQVVNYADRHGQVSFNLPHDKAALGRILRVMEELKGDPVTDGFNNGAGAGGSAGARTHGDYLRVFQDYTINGPTLEEVFMNVAKERGVRGGV
ncbi:hypothetical protein FQN54_007033 [Arachnomyces sp. PD_36]|nr:hypothetical protein FQN54_007033 [Arachnomyces sp. PD_36]